MPRLCAGVAAVAALLVTAGAASGRENLDTERTLGDILMEEPLEQRAPVIRPKNRSWVILPQVGYSPERGPNGGIKFVDRDLTPAGLTLDVDGVYALRRQHKYEVTVAAPSLAGGRLIAMIEGKYLFDPRKEFFGVGNNEVGPDPVSTHEYRVIMGLGTLALRPWPRLMLALTGGFDDVDIERGDLEDGVPSTVDLFPGVVGIGGGRANPLSFSIVFNNREDITRPTRGWSFAAKIQHVNRELGNDFHFTRYILDASYLLPLLTRRQVLGLRVAGEFIDAKRRRVPFFELASLGGADDLRGYFQDRFLGRSRVMINGEYRLKLLDFDFFDVWRVRIDGVGFGDMGRVFLGDTELREEFSVDPDLVPRLFRDFRFSYGGGLRFALGEAVIARLDVGFSDEERGLVYLTFGHTF
ncbi:MAG: BamA/TamA family outer membrane protein [Candidatus Binatia bacterium]